MKLCMSWQSCLVCPVYRGPHGCSSIITAAITAAAAAAAAETVAIAITIALSFALFDFLIVTFCNIRLLCR